jgi:thymidylate synthase
MKLIKGKTFASVYEQVLSNIYYNYEYTCKPRDQEIKEITNLIIEIEDPTSNLFINEVRSTPERYLAAELYWYFSGRNDVEFISNYSKFWNKIVNLDNKTVNSAYGYLLFKDFNMYGINEWRWALNSLIKDKDSRQAIIRFNKPRHSYNNVKDFVCTLIGIFNIRDNKLNFTIIMRSQDEIKGRTFDVPFFTLLQQQMLNHLRTVYSSLQLGSFVQHNISSHIYERDFELVENMLANKFESNRLPSLKNNLIDVDGNFTFDFQKSNDKLITWIKDRL